MTKEGPYVGMVYGAAGCVIKVERIENGRIYLRNLKINHPYSIPEDFWDDLRNDVLRLVK